MSGVIRTLLSAGLLDLVGHADADKSVVWLELLHGLVAVVDEGEAGALATTVLGAETEDGDLVLGSLVQLGQLGAELILGDVGAVGVEDVTVRWSLSVIVAGIKECGRSRWAAILSIQDRRKTHTTICLRASSGLRMNLRVRRVTWDSDMIAMVVEIVVGAGFEGRRPGVKSTR